MAGYCVLQGNGGFMTPDDYAKLIQALKKECPDFEVRFFREVDAVTGVASDVTWSFKYSRTDRIWGDSEYGRLKGFIEGYLRAHCTPP